MSIPATPTGFFIQSANLQILVSFDQSPGAATYDIQRSLDNITYSSVATPAVNSYLDTTVTAGIQYWYKVAAVSGSGTSPYTVPASEVPTIAGENTLGQLRLNAMREADRVNSNFLTVPEWNFNINNSLFELYDLLIDTYDDYYFAQPAYFTTDGTNSNYSLPNGILPFNDQTGTPFTAPPFYKLAGVDLGVNNSPTGWVTMAKYNFIDRNQYFYPNTNSTLYGVFNMSYRVLGNQLTFIPLPSGNQPIRIWYIPRMVMLLRDTDTTSSGISGWQEYVIVDAAIKALEKEESDTSALVMRKEGLRKRIEASASNRDQGRPDTISDSRRNGSWGQAGGIQGFGAGY